MRRVTVMAGLAAAVVLMAAGLGAQAKTSFAGEWKVAGDPDSGAGRSEPGKDLTITQSATTMTVEYKAASQAPAPAKLTYNLDGSPSKNTTAARGTGAPAEQTSKAVWTANKLVVTTTTAGGEEKRTFSIEGGDLVVETSEPARAGGAPRISKVVYKRYERGHGG